MCVRMYSFPSLDFLYRHTKRYFVHFVHFRVKNIAKKEKKQMHGCIGGSDLDRFAPRSFGNCPTTVMSSPSCISSTSETHAVEAILRGEPSASHHLLEKAPPHRKTCCNALPFAHLFMNGCSWKTFFASSLFRDTKTEDLR